MKLHCLKKKPFLLKTSYSSIQQFLFFDSTFSLFLEGKNLIETSVHCCIKQNENATFYKLILLKIIFTDNISNYYHILYRHIHISGTKKQYSSLRHLQKLKKQSL